MHETEFAVHVFILLLLVASIVAMATKWIRVPYTLALVIMGLIISLPWAVRADLSEPWPVQFPFCPSGALWKETNSLP
jgi:Kef-type K+ transport system membrane component KefB